jgi:hypothetical protein
MIKKFLQAINNIKKLFIFLKCRKNYGFGYLYIKKSKTVKNATF